MTIIIKIFAYISMIISAVIFIYEMAWLGKGGLPFVLAGLALNQLLLSGAVIVLINKVQCTGD